MGYTVRTLRNESAGARAIREALTNFAENAFDDKDGTVLFYFSGHGIVDATQKKLFLATFNATRDSLAEEGLALDEVDQLLQKTRAKRRIMWIDACRNMVTPGSRSAFSVPRTPVEFATSQGTRILYAAESNGLSYEYDELKHGVFTHFLLKGLSGEASGSDGYITFNDLANYVRGGVRDWTLTNGRTQVPYASGEHSGDFLIGINAPRSTPTPVVDVRRETTERIDTTSTSLVANDILEIRRMHEKEQWGESLPMLNRLLASGTQTPELLALRSHAYSHLGRPVDALADGQKAVSVGPRVAEAYLRRGEAFMSESKYKEALADFDRSLELDPKEAETWGNRGATLAALGQHSQAVESHTKGLAVRSDRYDLFVARGASYAELGQFKSAIADLTSAIQLRPRDAVLYAARASAYVRDQQLEAALKDANEALRLQPDNADSLVLRGYVYTLLGSRDRAIEDYRYATRLRPDMKEVAEALRVLESGGPVSPGNGATPPPTPGGSGTTAPSYARLDDARAAISAQRVIEANELIEQMIRLDPARSEGWTLRGSLAMVAFDNLAMAYESYQNALSRGGVVAFRVAHDHGMDQAPCFGPLYLSPAGVEFAGETGHRFNWPHTAIQEAAINDFYGSALGMFHIKTARASGGSTFNFAVVRPADVQFVNRRADADMLLSLLNRFKR
jgi:tetratricopeptide (TPR) repeat protein